jgi:hypothetical protein
MEKPHKGTIENWFKLACKQGLGYAICGWAVGHPQFNGEGICTSYVVEHDEATGEVETRNSRYTLGKPRKED